MGVERRCTQTSARRAGGARAAWARYSAFATKMSASGVVPTSSGCGAAKAGAAGGGGAAAPAAAKMPGRRIVIRRPRLRGGGQRAAAVAHLHRGRIACARAQHESLRNQDAERQCRQEQQSHQQASRRLADRAQVHQGRTVPSTGDGRQAHRNRDAHGREFHAPGKRVTSMSRYERFMTSLRARACGRRSRGAPRRSRTARTWSSTRWARSRRADGLSHRA